MEALSGVERQGINRLAVRIWRARSRGLAERLTRQIVEKLDPEKLGQC